MIKHHMIDYEAHDGTRFVTSWIGFKLFNKGYAFSVKTIKI